MKSAVALANELSKESFDLVIFSNGIITTKERKQSSEGVELDLAVSYLSRFAFLKTWLASTSSSIGASRGIYIIIT